MLFHITNLLSIKIDCFMKKICLFTLLLNISLLTVLQAQEPLLTGADRTDLYVSYLKNKNIGMVVNQTSIIGKNEVSSIDSLLKLGIHITKIFGPEHGFRGNASN